MQSVINAVYIFLCATRLFLPVPFSNAGFYSFGFFLSFSYIVFCFTKKFFFKAQYSRAYTHSLTPVLPIMQPHTFLVFCKRNLFSIHFPFLCFRFHFIFQAHKLCKPLYYWLWCHHVMGLSPPQAPWNYSHLNHVTKSHVNSAGNTKNTLVLSLLHLFRSWIITLKFMLFFYRINFLRQWQQTSFSKCCWTLINDRML